jgi:hypothetical protein
MIRNIKGYDKPQRLLVVERKFKYIVAYDPEYHPVGQTESIRFHLNDGCHCATNEITALAAMFADSAQPTPCGCLDTEDTVIKEADEEDLENYPRTFEL